MHSQKQKEIFLRFGDLMDYPSPELIRQTEMCADLLHDDLPDAFENVKAFLHFTRENEMGRLEEIYTSTFDVSPTCYIFAGYMLFGESFKRGEFLVRLQEKYKEKNFSQGKELADHLAVLYRFMATLDEDDPLREQLIAQCMLPVLNKMSRNFKSNTTPANPYAGILRAMIEVLEKDRDFTEKQASQVKEIVQ
jgi:nitrate reductase delta subunit